MKALIIEDDLISGKLLSKILETYFSVDIADSGLEGLKRFNKAFQSETMYDVIFLDIMMPMVNGHEVLKKIREIEYQEEIFEGVKIIMVTALDDFKNLKDAFNEQCDYYVMKPITPENIRTALKKVGLL